MHSNDNNDDPTFEENTALDDQTTTPTSKVLNVKVKTLAVGLPTMTVPIKSDDLVINLKQVISKIHEGHPDCSRQRLIYNRKELKDDTQKLSTLKPKIHEDCEFSMVLELSQSPSPSSTTANNTTCRENEKWTIRVNHPPYELQVPKTITISDLQKLLTIQEPTDGGKWSLLGTGSPTIINQIDTPLDMIEGVSDGCTLDLEIPSEQQSDPRHFLFLELRLYDGGDHLSVSLKVKVTDTIAKVQQLTQEAFLRECSKVVPANRQKLVCNGQVKSEDSPISSFQTGDRGHSAAEPLIIILHVRDRDRLLSGGTGSQLLGDIQDTITDMPSAEPSVTDASFLKICTCVTLELIGLMLIVAFALLPGFESGQLHFVRASKYQSSCVLKSGGWYGTTLVKFTHDPWSHPTCKTNCRYFLDDSAGLGCNNWVTTPLMQQMPNQVCELTKDHSNPYVQWSGAESVRLAVGSSCETTSHAMSWGSLLCVEESVSLSHPGSSCSGSQVENELIDYSGTWTNCSTLCYHWCTTYQHGSTRCCNFEYVEDPSEGHGCKCRQHGDSSPLYVVHGNELEGSLEILTPIADSVSTWNQASFYKHEHRTILGVADLFSGVGYNAAECCKKCLQTMHCRTFITSIDDYCELWSVAPQESGTLVRKENSHLFTLADGTLDVTCYVDLPERYSSKGDCDRYFLTLDLNTPFAATEFYLDSDTGTCSATEPSTIVSEMLLAFGCCLLVLPVTCLVGVHKYRTRREASRQTSE